MKMSTRRDEQGLDSYLLRVFCLVVTERNVSRVALRMKQSQPAISAALRKLRDVFGDPLLVREKGGMVPTERALALLSHAKVALAEIDQMVQSPDSFDPQTSKLTFRIGAPDYIAPSFMASVIERFRREAPCARLVIQSLGPNFDFERSLAEGELDVVIGNWPEPPPRMHLSMLLEDQIVCLVNARHPLVTKGITAQSYAKGIHIVPMPYSISQRGVIDNTLASLRIVREECVTVQSFTTVPYLLQKTDLIFTTTLHFARFYAEILQLVILPAPIDFPPMRFYQLWHERNHKSPAHRWIRKALNECGQELNNRLRTNSKESYKIKPPDI